MEQTQTPNQNPNSNQTLNQNQNQNQNGNTNNVPLGQNNSSQTLSQDQIVPDQQLPEKKEKGFFSSLFGKKKKNDGPKFYRFETIESSNEIPNTIHFPDTIEEISEQGYLKIKIYNFSCIKDFQKHYIEPLEVAGKTWRILIFPQGNRTDSISLYLDFSGPKEGKWAVCSQFSLTIHGEEQSVSREAQHRFCEEEVDWGFTQFLAKKVFYNEDKGKRFIVDDCVTISIGVRVMKDPTGILWHKFINYDSKAETNCVGLKNQGATCYMNSILQSLFFTNMLRKAVFQMPTVDDDPLKSIPLALQRVFYHLQYSSQPVGTTELTKTFGWDTAESFMQHDVQEFNRVLCDKLESQMKGTSVEGTISKLFEGKMRSYVRCKNVNYESYRDESFYDIQLNVKGLKNLQESFDDYIQVETLDGDNKYFAEGYGLQEAEKGVIFLEYPPVLHLQLKRFEYDVMKDAMVKINDKHEFPESIDLTKYLLDPSASPPQIYHLYGVLVHSGDLHGGHYCAFIKPDRSNDIYQQNEDNDNNMEEKEKPEQKFWLKFDDDRVTRALPREALDDNYGMDKEASLKEDEKMKEMAMKPTRFSKKFTNAYMLVYIRESNLNEILCPVEQSIIPEVTRERFIREQQIEEQKRKEKEEQHLYVNVCLVTLQVIKDHHATDLFVPKNESLYFKVKKTTTFEEFKELVEDRLSIPVKRQRHWIMAKRQNGTIRPDENLDNFTNESIQTIKETLKLTLDPHIFVEESTVDPMENDKVQYFEPFNRDTDILIFVKSYDAKRALLQFEGYFIMKSNDRPLDLISLLNTKNGRPQNSPLKMYEEVRPTMVEKIKLKDTFSRLEIGTGDIIVYEEEIPDEELKGLSFPHAPVYYEHMINSVVVQFRSKIAPKDQKSQFTLQLSKKNNYDFVAKQVAHVLSTDHMMLRFYSYNPYVDTVRQDIKYNPQTLLEDMLQTTDVLFYEKLDISVLEMESKKSLNVLFVNSSGQEEGPFKILVSKNGTVQDVIEKLKSKLDNSQDQDNGNPREKIEMKDIEKGKEKIRFFEIFHSQIYKNYPLNEPIKNAYELNTFVVEKIPEDQLHPHSGDVIIPVFHFYRDVHYTFGTPFYFLIKQGEKFEDTYKRLQKRLGVSDKDFEKYKFSLHVPRSEYKLRIITLEDNPMLSAKVQSADHLALDHMDKNSKTSKLQERGLVIRDQ